MHHVALLGDSILDNASYAAPDPDTATHLRAMLGAGWTVDLLAQDGATMADVPRQLARLPATTATAVLSIGGNDVTGHIGLLADERATGAAVLGELLEIADGFSARYEEVAGALVGRVPRVVLCTIYEVPLQPRQLGRLARAPLAMLNDHIIRSAARLGTEVLELRDVCTAAEDFVLEIEPSSRGARKIAAALAAVLRDAPGVRTGRLHSVGR